MYNCNDAAIKEIQSELYKRLIKSKGIKVVDNLNNCDVILGVKEIPIKLLLL